MRLPPSLVVTAIGLFFAACVPPRGPRPLVRYVPTETPGVTYVIVRPVPPVNAKPIGKGPDEPGFAPSSEYILRCDARGAQGMDCRLVSEVSRAGERLSPAPKVTTEPKAIKTGIGALHRSEIQVTEAPNIDAGAPAAAPAVTPTTDPSGAPK